MSKLGGVLLVLLLTLGAVPAQAATYTTARCGNTSGRVLLTFDDWAVNPYTDKGDPYRTVGIGAYLEGRDVRAAFFLTGRDAAEYPDIVTELRQQGHWVLNHTYSHADLLTLSDSAVRSEIRDGVDSNRLRPPYSHWDTRVANIASSLGYRICWGTINTQDWQQTDGQLVSAAGIRSRVRNAPASTKQSGVIIGHLWTNYPDALGGIIDDLHQDGYRMCRNRGPAGPDMPYPMRCDPL